MRSSGPGTSRCEFMSVGANRVFPSTRQALESQYQLKVPQHDSGRTWSYLLVYTRANGRFNPPGPPVVIGTFDLESMMLVSGQSH
jgi:hypothetical protein